MAEVDVAEVVLRPGTTDDIAGFRALGEAGVPPTYPAIFQTSLARNTHLDQQWPDDVWLRKRLGKHLRKARTR